MPPFSTSWAMRSGGFQEVLFRNCCGRHDLRMDNAQHEHHYKRAQYLAERYSLEKIIIVASLRVYAFAIRSIIGHRVRNSVFNSSRVSDCGIVEEVVKHAWAVVRREKPHLRTSEIHTK